MREKYILPAISTGVFGYPVEEAAYIALDEIKRFLEKHDEIELVRMVLYSKDDYEIHLEKARDLFLSNSD